MRKPRTHAPDSPLGLLVADLQSLRKGSGLTRAKVAKAETLCSLDIVRREARRLKRPGDAVAHALVTVAAASMENPGYKELLTNAYAIGDAASGKNLAERRRRIGLTESRTREREDEALEELARWLMTMTDPGVRFGNYLSPEVYLPAPDWQPNSLAEPVGPDEIHPLGELMWEQLEKTVVLNERGFAEYTETRGLVRALIDGVTGYTVFYLNRGNPTPERLRAIVGGTQGRHRIDPVVGDTSALNINFRTPLLLGQTLRLHWVIDLPEPLPGATPETGWAAVADVHTRNLTLRVQFDEHKLPVLPHYFVARPRFLQRPLTQPRELKIQPGHLISYTWSETEEGKAYTLRWDWPEMFKAPGLTKE